MSESRSFIRHPVDIPIEFSSEEDPSLSRPGSARDLSLGGLAFEADQCPGSGTIIEVRIPTVDPPFETHGQVVWCRDVDGGYEIGIRFLESSDAFKARMVEQVCHIEQYRRDVLENEGRDLSADAAAREWISRFGSRFPRPSGEAG